MLANRDIDFIYLTQEGQSIQIDCPMCKRKQTMQQSFPEPWESVWFPVAPFCCDIMRHADTPEWNAQLDKEIQKVWWCGYQD